MDLGPVPDAGAALALLAIGACAGLLSSLLGIGGGLVMVPLLGYGLGYPFPAATAASLVAMAVQTPMGVYQHARRGAVSWSLALPMAAGGALGVLCGLYLQPRIEVPYLKLLFAAVMAFAAWRLVARPPLARGRIGKPAVAAIGAGAGVASRLLGIGGGLVTVPLLALGGVPMHEAVGTSLVPVFTNAALAAVFALAAGTPVVPCLLLAGAALATSPVGARLAHGVDAARLKRIFAVALVGAALLVAATSGVGARS